MTAPIAQARQDIGAAATQVGPGCAPLVEFGRAGAGERRRRNVEATAWEAGIRYLDTSPWYGRGLSELRLGRVSGVMATTSPRRVHRCRHQGGSNVPSPAGCRNYRSEFWAGGLPFEHRFDYTYEGIMRSYEAAGGLGLNTIDLF